jgi:alpha-tubulin suppressor-like RCC1 family protein
LLESEQAICWGSNVYGESGLPNSASKVSPSVIQGLEAPQQLALGDSHGCALLASGGVACWGRNNCGQRGDENSTVDRYTAERVAGIESATAVVAGGNHSCALLRDSSVVCWGQLRDQCEYYDLGTTYVPQAVANLTGVTALSTRGHHTCARVSDGTVKCWGSNSWGQLGDDASHAKTDVLRIELALGSAAGVAAGSEFNCAWTSQGALACWGNNNWGQLGWGAQWLQHLPVVVQGLPKMTP